MAADGVTGGPIDPKKTEEPRNDIAPVDLLPDGGGKLKRRIAMFLPAAVTINFPKKVVVAVASGLLLSGIYWIDLRIPSTYTVWLCYILVTFSGLWIPFRYVSIFVAGVSTLLILIAYALPHPHYNEPLAERIICIGIVWIVAWSNTHHKRLYRDARRLSELYATLNAVNQTIVHARDEESLLREICRTVVTTGKYRMSWVGRIDPATPVIKPCVSYGNHTGYLENIRISVSESPEGRGPTGTALRERRVAVCDNIITDERFTPWRDKALRAGFRSSASLPIFIDDKLYGCLNVYDAEPRHFQEREIELLMTLISDVSLALQTYKREEARRSIEQRLRKKEEQVQVLANKSRDMMFILRLHPVSFYEYVSPASEMLVGYTPEEICGDPEMVEKLVHPEDRPLWSAFREMRGRRAQPESPFRIRWIHRDGHVVWTEQRLLFVRDEKGELQSIEGIVRDVTERMEAEVQAELVIKASATGIWDWRVGSDVMFYSDVGKGLLGITEEGNILTFEEYRSRIHPEDRDRTMQHLEDYLAHPAGEFEIILRLRHADGGYRWILSRANALTDGTGKPYRLLGSHLDITRQKELENQARLDEQRLAALTRNTPVYLVEVDREGYIRYINKAYQGVRVEQVMGTRIADWFPPAQHGAIRSAFQRVFDTGRAETIEYSIPNPEGELRSYMTQITPVTGEADVACVVFSATDITEKIRTEEELRSAHEALRSLAATISDMGEADRRKIARELHDQIGQNLSAMLLNMNIIRQSLPPEANAQVRGRLSDSVGLVEETIDRTRTIMSDLRPSVLDDYGLCAAIKWSADQFAERLGIPVRVLCPASHRERFAPRIETILFRIAQEALTNCAKHAKAQNIEIAMQEREGMLELSIRDDGVGICGETGEKKKGKGAGWGVAIMRERVASVNGSLEIRSEPGRGTTLTAMVPAELAPACGV